MAYSSTMMTGTISSFETSADLQRTLMNKRSSVADRFKGSAWDKAISVLNILIEYPKTGIVFRFESDSEAVNWTEQAQEGPFTADIVEMQNVIYDCNKLHAPESLRNSQIFTDPEDSLPRSQEPFLVILQLK
jgi:hypothetical protein